MMTLQRGARLLVTPNNRGKVTEVVAFDQNFKGQVGLSQVGIKSILCGWDSLSEEKALGDWKDTF